MGISFSVVENIQKIRIEGGLSPEEEAAVRLRIDQKITMGRSFLAFDLSSFNMDDPSSLVAFHSIIRFCVERKATVASFGLPRNLWKRIMIPDAKEFDKFEAESEALKWFKVQAAKTPNQEVPKTLTEADIKQKHIMELISKYEVFHEAKDYDPLRIGKAKLDYESHTNRPSLLTLLKSFDFIEGKKDLVRSLEERCKEVSDKLFPLMQLRKAPISEKELGAIRKTLEATRHTVETEISHLQTEIDKNKKAQENWKLQAKKHHENWEARLRDAEGKNLEQKKRNDAEVLELQKKLEAAQAKA